MQKRLFYLLLASIIIIYVSPAYGQGGLIKNYFNDFNHLRGDIFSGTEQQDFVKTEGAFLFASNHITIPLAFDFYTRKTLSGTDITNSEKNIRGINTLGSRANASLSYHFKLADGKQLQVAYEAVNIQSMRHTDDLFRLAMKGNAQFENKVARAGNLNYKKMVYDKLSVGLRTDKLEGSNPLNFTYGLSVVKGIGYHNLQADQLDVFTAANGEYLEFKIKSEYTRNIGDRGGVLAARGLGAALWGGINVSLSGTASFTATIADLGFLAWNNQSQSYKADTSFTVEAPEVNNLFAVSEAYQGYADSLVDIIYGSEKKGSTTRMLPFNVSLNYKMQFNPKLYLDVNFVQYFIIAFRPQLTAGVMWFVNDKLYLQPALQIGGFSPFNARINSGFRISKNIEAQAGIFSFENLPMPKSRYAVGCNAALYLQLK